MENNGDTDLIEELSKVEDLKTEDFVRFEQYGGGLDECSLKGTRNALRRFALEILNVTAGEGYDYDFFDSVDEKSVIHFDSIEVVENVPGTSIEYKPLLKDRLIGFMLFSFICAGLFFCVFGFFAFLSMVFKQNY